MAAINPMSAAFGLVSGALAQVNILKQGFNKR